MLRSTMLFLVCILILASACQVNPRASAKPEQEGLSRYVGMDLRELGFWKRMELKRSIYRLTGVKVKTGMSDLRPWWLAEYRNGKVCWVLLEVYNDFSSPGVSYMRLHSFDKSWQHLDSYRFMAGYDMVVSDARILRNPILGTDVIEISTYVLLEFYVFIGERIALVRLEDNKGNPVQNSYASRGPSIGPHIPERTAREWRESLDSENPYEVLETLVWLSGLHLTSDSLRVPHVSQESVEDSTLFEAVRDSPEVKQKLLELRDSPNIWIRQAAELAIAHEHDRIRETDIRMFPPPPRSSSK